jgi:hypothetical protein
VEVLFDRICRENEITHRLTAPYSPTTTGKIERFHRSLRLEFLAGRVFASLGQAQEELDAWVHSYNHERPHQGIAMATPAHRFAAATRPPAPSAASPVSAIPDRPAAGKGGQWVTRKVGANGVICVAHQQIPVGKHRAGEIVDVHVDGQLLQAWHGNELLKTITRDNTRQVRKKNAAETR